MKRRTVFIFEILALVLSLSAVAFAQEGGKLNRQPINFFGINLTDALEQARVGHPVANRKIAAKIENAFAAKEAESQGFAAAGQQLVGTWNVVVPPNGDAGFSSLQTFHSDGTFAETSSLLATGTEGPAQGVYEPYLNYYLLTFELFAFDPQSKSSIGRLRIRNLIQLNDNDHFISYYAVDFIEPDGSVTTNIGTGIFRGTRMQVR